MLEAPADLRRAVGVDAAHGGEVRIAEDRAAARRTFRRHAENFFLSCACGGIHADHGGDHFAGLLDEDPVADADVLARDFLLVVQRGAGHAAAGDLHGLELGNRCERAGAAHLHGNIVEACARSLGLVFVGHRPAGGLRRAARLPAATEGVELDDRAIGLECEAVAQPVEFRDGRTHAGRIVSLPEFRDHRQTGCLEPAEKSGLRLRRTVALDGTEPVENGVEPARGDNGRVEQLEGAGRRIARVGEGRLALVLALPVERGEFFLREVNFAADFEKFWRVAVELQRDGSYRADVLCDIVTGGPVAAGCREFEHPLAVGQRERDAVHLRLDRPAQRDAGKQPPDARQEGVRLLQRVGVVEALHGHPVAHLRETFQRPAAHAPGGGVRCLQFRVRVFQIAQLAQKGVIFAVGDFRRGALVVEPVVAGDFVPQFSGAG